MQSGIRIYTCSQASGPFWQSGRMEVVSPFQKPLAWRAHLWLSRSAEHRHECVNDWQHIVLGKRKSEDLGLVLAKTSTEKLKCCAFLGFWCMSESAESCRSFSGRSSPDNQYLRVTDTYLVLPQNDSVIILVGTVVAGGKRYPRGTFLNLNFLIYACCNCADPLQSRKTRKPQKSILKVRDLTSGAN